MAAVSQSIVREYFELHSFLVRQHRKFVPSSRRQEDEDDIDFFVLNPHSKPSSTERPFILTSSDLSSISTAIIVVKGWHTETFSSARLSGTPELFRFVEPKAFLHAARAFGPDARPLKILVVPALPTATNARNESVSLLRSKGIDAVISFRSMLLDLVNQTHPNRNYQKSDLLQVIRILKNYDFLKEPQLEFFKSRPKKR